MHVKRDDDRHVCLRYAYFDITHAIHSRIHAYDFSYSWGYEWICSGCVHLLYAVIRRMNQRPLCQLPLAHFLLYASDNQEVDNWQKRTLIHSAYGRNRTFIHARFSRGSIFTALSCLCSWFIAARVACNARATVAYLHISWSVCEYRFTHMMYTNIHGAFVYNTGFAMTVEHAVYLLTRAIVYSSACYTLSPANTACMQCFQSHMSVHVGL